MLEETGVEPACQCVLPVTGSGAGEGQGWHGGANPQGSPEHHVFPKPILSPIPLHPYSFSVS